MALLEQLGADDLRRAVQGYRDALATHRDAINRLNVYPVPDGDTGTNMALTLESVVAELDGAGPDMAATCKAISHGSLMGARGNSGVILSQVLRGLADVFAEHDECDAAAFVRALDAAAAAAYGAVMRPVEGTILTVVRESAEAATAHAAAEGDALTLVSVLDVARVAGGESLERTPELLPVLADAGVVDAGGAGFLLLLDVLLNLTDGRDIPEPPEGSVEPQISTHGDDHARSAEHDALAGLKYEVMYFLEAPDETIPAFKDVWAGIGDSIVVVGGDGIWNCHIHTDDIGASIEAALDCGRPRNIRVTDLLEQVGEEKWVREAEAHPEPAPDLAPVPCAVVAVSTGDGIRRIFHSLGVQGTVTGGQSMNPSTAQLLEAVEAAPADHVVILPNNKNIIPVAQQVDAQTSKTVRVVPTRGIAEGFASLLAYDPQATSDDNLEEMAAAAEAVLAGEVTQAVRDSTCDVGPIKEGDFLGIAREGIRSVEPTVAEAATVLLGELITDDHEILTIIEGEGATDGITRQITEWLAEHHPDVEAEVHHGGQPLYPYFFGIE
ncbi:MAG: DAK2 domain-containing protein [Acidimicrobiales bacterium]|nr:DAK2 domain-containing protein [Acidimicrobiales bacterium]